MWVKAAALLRHGAAAQELWCGNVAAKGQVLLHQPILLD